MKVERIKAEPVFAPIVITLETEEEAAHLWHRLNNACDISYSTYCRREGVKEKMSLNSLIWNELSKVYTPKEEH